MSADGAGRRSAAPGALLLRALRLKAGLTQEMLAHQSGVSDRTVRGLEAARTSRPHRNTLEALARTLELDGSDTDRLVMAWSGANRMRLAEMFSDSAAEDDVSRRHREVNAGVDIRTSHDLATIGPDGAVSHVQVHETFDVVAPGTDRLLWAFSVPPEHFDPDLITIDSCVNFTLGPKHVQPERSAVAFEALLGEELPVGRAYGIDYRIVIGRNPARPFVEPDTLHGHGITVPVRSLFLQVQFHPARLPKRIWHVRQVMVNNAIERVAELAISTFCIAQLWLEPAPQGIHGIQWEW